MRTVYFFGLKGMESEEDALEADNGSEAAGGFTGGKKFVEEYSRAMTARKWEQAEYRVHEPATGSGPSRAIYTWRRRLRHKRNRQVDANRLFFRLVRSRH